MKKMILMVITCLITVLAHAQSKEKVALYVIGDITESIQKVVSSKATTRISRSNRYIAVERTEDFLNALSKEQDYQVSGEVSDDQIAQLGVRFGVRYVAVFEVNLIEETCFMAARLIDVESGLVIKSVDTSRQIKNIEDWINITNNVCYRLVSEKSK